MSPSAFPLLSVCSPTYNRPEALRRGLQALLPQLNSRCELVIFDNCSPEPVEDGLRDLLTGFIGCEVRIFRNAVNVGANANILRCLEYACGEWVWLLGDDDPPVENAIANVLEDIAAFPQATFINFATGGLAFLGTVRPKTFTTEGLDGFVRHLDCWANTLFISAGVYHRAKVVPALRLAYSYIYSHGSHLAAVLISLRLNGGTVVFSHRETVGLYFNPDHWDWKAVQNRVLQLLEILPDKGLREVWLAKTYHFVPVGFMGLKGIFLTVVKEKGRFISTEDTFRVLGYLAGLVPSMRKRLILSWLVAFLGRVSWPFFYVIWQLKGWWQTRPSRRREKTEAEVFFRDERL